jgi:DMSO reductase family type II enzyme chaperone
MGARRGDGDAAREEPARLVLGEDAPAEVLLAACRSRAYEFFAGAVDYPYEPLLRRMQQGELQQELRVLLESAPELAVAPRVDWEGLADVAADPDTLPVEYTRLFDVGGGTGPPCPLYGGSYGGDRMKVMEEAVRFYNFFDLHLAEKQRELPDHLSIQLEFLHFLTYREVQALQAGEDAAPLRRAQQDFLTRHPGKWIPKLRERLAKHEGTRYYRSLFDALGEFLAADSAHLRDLLSA